MKMTDADERALAAIEDAIRTSSYGAFAPGRTALIEARDHIRARLAAGQQKGGGEETAINESLADSVFAEWLMREMPPGTIISSPLWWSSRIARAYRHTHSTPQPSIPAPAQEGPVVDEAMARRYLAAQKAHVSKVDAAFGRQAAGALHSDDVVAACMAGLAAAFNVTAQQDGKASGGEVVVIDGKRYAVETVRTALLGLAVDLARERAHPPHADQETQG